MDILCFRQTLRPLAIANGHGNCDLAHGPVPKGYAHVSGQRLQALCKRHKVRFVRAVVRFEYSKYGIKPIFDGVIVTRRSLPKIQKLIEDQARRRLLRNASQIRQALRVLTPEDVAADSQKRLALASTKLRIVETPTTLCLSPENVGTALYLLNKRAKTDSRHSQRLYKLKDAVIKRALVLGWALFICIHKTTYHQWSEWYGYGYSSTRYFRLYSLGNDTFHQPYSPSEDEAPTAVDLGDDWRSPPVKDRGIDIDTALLTCSEFVEASRPKLSIEMETCNE